MGKARWAAASGLVATAALFVALWPSNCEGKTSGRAQSPLVPEDLTKVCETPIGTHISWPYNPETFSHPTGGGFSVGTGPTEPNWPWFLGVVAGGGVVAALLTLLALVIIPARSRSGGFPVGRKGSGSDRD